MKKTAVLSFSLVALTMTMVWADPGLSVRQDRQYTSGRPLYFRVVFDKAGRNAMSGVVDESKGTGMGYDVACFDENLNGNLADEQPRRSLAANGRGPVFEFNGPLGESSTASYRLNIGSLADGTRRDPQMDLYYFHWQVKAKGWYCFFINGKMRLFSSAADALKGSPVRLGGECSWDISSKAASDGKVLVSAALKDGNGCTLRVAGNQDKQISPLLTLIKDGKVLIREKMTFG